MKKGNKENQHYVPQFYLRNFSDNGKNIGMYRFDGDKFIPNASIKSVAYRKYLYGEDGELEDILSKYESIWGKVIRKIIENKSIKKTLNYKEYNSLLQFFSVSEVRTSKVADDLNELYDTMLKVSRDMRKSHGLEEPNEHEEYLKKMKLTPNIMAVITGMKEGKDILYNLFPVLLINKTNHDFITCDNPMIKYNQLYRYRNYYNNYGWGTAGIQLFFVISPKLTLCLYDSFVYNAKESGDFYINFIAKNQVMEINKLVAHNAYESLFFNKADEYDIKNIINNKQEINSKESTRVFYKHGNKNEVMIGFGNRSIIRNVKLDFFQIEDKYKTIDLPLHAGGLVREDMIMEKIIKKMNGEDNEYDED